MQTFCVEIMKIVFILFIFLLPLLSFSQQSDSQLAYTYYQNKEYDKAAEVFLKLYERTRSSNFLDYHIICLINSKHYEQAEEVLKKYLKTNSTNKDFLINLGYIYEQQGKNKKAAEYYEKAVKNLLPQSSDINNLAYKFRNLREYEWAIKTYLRGRELLKQPNAFMTELGDNYMMERNYDRMFALFVQALELRPGDLNTITSKLGFARSYDIVNNVDAVIDRNLDEILSKAEYAPVFDELTVWYALQKKDYSKALHHATLLNQKAENKLYIFINIARDASNNEEYTEAIRAFQQILDRGKENNNLYVTARKEILTCEYKKLLATQASREQYLTIASESEKYMQEYGFTPANVDMAVLLSDIYAYQLQMPDSANQILEQSINIRRLNGNTLNMLKSKRADLLTFMDNPWEATILYTQIEKANPNNDIGYEAKLKKAWLAYYSGDILWARAQFDVLKGATTKLIANDAIKMSHFLNTNYEPEESNTDLETLARTEYQIYKQQYQDASVKLDSLISHSKPGIADYASLLKAKLLYNKQRYTEAIPILERLKEHAEQKYMQAEAIYELANLKTQMQETQTARELYKLLVSEYSGSVYSVEAGRLYRESKE